MTNESIPAEVAQHMRPCPNLRETSKVKEDKQEEKEEQDEE